MKVKLLLFPLSIVIALALSVFWIQPEVSSALSLREQNNAASARLAEMDRVIANIDTLDRSLSNNAGDRQFVETYLPSKGSDDAIIDEVNFLAGETGLLLVSAELKPISSELAQAAAQQVQTAADQTELSANSPGSLIASGTPLESGILFTASSPSVRVRSTEVSVSAFGKYDQIKMFTDRIYHANHFQNFVSTDIAQKAQAQPGSPSSTLAPDVLNATFVIRFSTLPTTTVSSGVFLDTFKTPTFRLAVVQDLRARVMSELPALTVTPTERPNPFLR